MCVVLEKPELASLEEEKLSWLTCTQFLHNNARRGNQVWEEALNSSSGYIKKHTIIWGNLPEILIFHFHIEHFTSKSWFVKKENTQWTKPGLISTDVIMFSPQIVHF